VNVLQQENFDLVLGKRSSGLSDNGHRRNT
jgi:hypothetical protein